MLPMVSVITPCYNGEAFLDKYFESILAQTYENLELIFVNDGSTDRTEEIALSYRSALEGRGIIFKYLYKPNGGQASAMNIGFRVMTGKYLVWPDSDDMLTSDSIEKRVRFLEENIQYGFVRSNGIFFDMATGADLQIVSDCDCRFREDIFLDLILDTTYCCCGCYMVRTDLLREIYPQLTIAEASVGQNWQILIPMAGRYLCGYIDEIQYRIAVNPGSHSRHMRSVQQILDRYVRLEKLLRLCVEISGRTDRDYNRIIDIKHLKTCLHVYVSHGDWKNAEKYYRQLRLENELSEDEKRSYMKLRNPITYKLYIGWCEVRHRIGNVIKRR